MAALSQTSTIASSSFSGGFGINASATTKVVSLAGVPFVGTASGTATLAKSGFLAGVSFSSSVNAIDDLIGVPSNFSLKQNYPNPFNPNTSLSFNLPHNTQVIISIHDLLGKEIARLANESMGPGFYVISWNGKNDFGESLPSGIYIVRLVTPEYSRSIKMLLLK